MGNKILTIDDDPSFVEAITTLLEAKDYQVISADNGEDGFKLAKSEKPDLILLDVMMTHKTEGFDVSRNLRSDKDTKDIPIIMITGIRREMNLPFGFEPDEDWLPVAVLLEKPIKPEVLLKTVEENIKK